SIVASDLPIKALAAIIIVIVVRAIIHCASPKRLTAVLTNAMTQLKKTTSDAFGAGRLSASEIEKLRLLEHKVSAIQAETLEDCRSYLGTICGFLKGCTFTVLLCIWEVQDLEMHIKVNVGQVVAWSRASNRVRGTDPVVDAAAFQ
ncbi:hypothetical protein B0H19DRAFT_1331284, partial [Mycena capillaripes]